MKTNEPLFFAASQLPRMFYKHAVVWYWQISYFHNDIHSSYRCHKYLKLVIFFHQQVCVLTYGLWRKEETEDFIDVLRCLRENR